jgi:hypothetical protein
MERMSAPAPVFNLNLAGYSFQQILNFFGYVPTDIIELDELTIRGLSLRQQLVHSGQIPAPLLNSVDAFVSDAVRWIEAVKCPSSSLKKAPLKSALPAEQTNTNHILPEAKHPAVHEDPAVKPAPYVVPTQITTGTRNPIQHPTIKRYVTIDSRTRENYYHSTASDFIMELPEKVSRIVDMQLSAFEIPMAFYNVSSHLQNNHFQLSYSVSVADEDETKEETEKITVVVPDGNYNALDLIQVINSILAPRNDEADLLFPNRASSYIQFQVDITESGGGTGKVTVNTVTNDVFSFSAVHLYFGKNERGEDDRLELPKKMGWILGFQKKEYEHATTYTSESIIDPGSMRYMYLAVDDYQRSTCSSFLSSMLPTDVLARITVKGTYFSLLMADNLNFITEPRRYFGPVDIRKVRIRLLDEWGRLVHLNAANFSICLTFTILYDMAI